MSKAKNLLAKNSLLSVTSSRVTKSKLKTDEVVAVERINVEISPNDLGLNRRRAGIAFESTCERVLANYGFQLQRTGEADSVKADGGVDLVGSWSLLDKEQVEKFKVVAQCKLSSNGSGVPVAAIREFESSVKRQQENTIGLFASTTVLSRDARKWFDTSASLLCHVHIRHARHTAGDVLCADSFVLNPAMMRGISNIRVVRQFDHAMGTFVDVFVRD